MVKLEEKASIDWNNYLTPTEVLLFLFVDDKTESAENIIYNTDGNFYKTYFKDFKKQGWTKDKLVQDLADFYYNNHLDEPKQDNYKMIGLDGNHNKHILGYSKTRDDLEDMCNKVKNDYYLKDVWVEENDDISGTNKVQENLEDQYTVLKTFIKEDPKYTDKYHIKDVVYKTTIKGQPMLEFSINGIDVKVLEYPKKDKKFYCYTNGEKYGYVSSVSHLIEQLVKKYKLEEVSRNELLAKTKMQTVSRYKRADGYKGFYLGDVDTDHLLTTDTLPVTCRVGDYWDTVELQNVLYWIQYTSEKNENNQVNNHSVRDAILQAVDAMDIKVNCECGDFIYRFAYQASKGGYKYGKPETRPAKITNPNDYGALCKHLTAMLSNKKWMQQVAAPVMDWIEKRIVEVNRFLKVKPGEELTLPNELARKNAKKGFYSKVFKGDEDVENEVEKDSEDNNTNAKDTSVSNSNRSINNNAVDNDVDNVDNNVENEEV